MRSACLSLGALNKNHFVILVSLYLCGCDAVPQDHIDRNGDGKPDLFIEYDSNGSYDLYDRNFDGTVDESWVYDSEGNEISGKVDEDLDGILETQYVYKDYSVSGVFSDTDGNGVFDVFTKLNYGVRVYSEKYYSLPDGNAIGRVEYEFGFPIGPEIRSNTTLTEREFQRERIN